MSEENKQLLPLTTEPDIPAIWTSAQAYVLAALCLVLGVALG
jgi:hypothetical protein